MNGAKTKTFRFLIAVIIACTLLATKTAEHAYADTPNTAITNATVTFTGGTLTLAEVPTFDFGEETIAGTTQNYEMEKAIKPIQISDLRGSHTGWKLTVSLSEFEDTQKQSSLQGAALNIATVSVVAVNDTVGEPPSVLGAPLKITADSSASALSVFTANTGIGGGVWQMTLADATLEVLPGSASAGANTATLTWTLQDTP